MLKILVRATLFRYNQMHNRNFIFTVIAGDVPLKEDIHIVPIS